MSKHAKREPDRKLLLLIGLLLAAFSGGLVALVFTTAPSAPVSVSQGIPAHHPTPTPSPAPQALMRYTVHAGDTLWGIAAIHCAHATDWPMLWNANRKTIGNDPNLIYPGQVLVLIC